MTKLGATDKALIEMLTEDTGRHMLDSGGAYGRNWERNQARDFMAEPSSTLTIRAGDWHDQHAEIEVTHSVFHWLRDRLDYEPKMTAAFKRFAAKPENEDKCWLELMEEYAHKPQFSNVQTVNTYNGEDLLSQTLQYTMFDCEESGEQYVLLQIHGGRDVRGGYTAPRVFRVMEEYAMWENAKAGIWEESDPVERDQLTLPGVEREQWGRNWFTDDGCHWYRDGACGRGVPPQLETYEVSTDPADKGNGKIYLDADGAAYGPLHGGRLYVY